MIVEPLSKWGRTLSRSVSFPKYYIKKQLRDFAQVIGPTPLVLDVGSGSLAPYRTLFDSEYYVALDYFERADVRSDAGNLPLSSEAASLVLATEVLEHLSDPLIALGEMNRVLGKGGHLLLTVPLIWGVHDYVDHRRWTERGLTKILQKAGFEIVHLKHRGGIFSTIGCMVTQIPVQLFGEMGQQHYWWTVGAYMFLWLILVPIPWLASIFDILDRKRDFTLGYTVLCRKREFRSEDDSDLIVEQQSIGILNEWQWQESPLIEPTCHVCSIDF